MKRILALLLLTTCTALAQTKISELPASSGALTASDILAVVELTGTPTTKKATLTQVKSALSLGSVENTALSTWAGSTSLTTLGTISAGTWNGTAISSTYILDGTIVNADINANAAIALSKLAPLTASAFVFSNGSGALESIAGSGVMQCQGGSFNFLSTSAGGLGAADSGKLPLFGSFGELTGTSALNIYAVTDNQDILSVDADGGRIHWVDHAGADFDIVFPSAVTNSGHYLLPNYAVAATSDTFAMLAEPQTLTSKTISGASNTITNLNASNLSSGTVAAARMPALTGDITTSAGAVATTLATVNSNVGSFGSATQSLTATVNAKGLVTAISAQTVTPAIGSVTGLGTGVATALGNATNGTGGLVTYSGNIGAPTGTVTNLTGTASININGTVGATTPATGAFTTLSASGVVTVSAGTVSAPAITTTGDTNTGIFFSAADNINFVTGGVSRWWVDSGGTLQGLTNSIQLTGNLIGSYFFARGGYYAMGASDDVVWQRLAANHGVFARSTNAQSMSVANTFTNSSNYEALTIDWSSNVARIKPTAAGTGTVRTIQYYTTSTVFWSSGSGSPESVVTAPVGSLYTRTDGGANTTLYVKESGAGNTGWIAK